MQTVLFNETIFGPIKSRRLGTSLGVNLSPRDGKVCSFDCLYCEAGFNAQGKGSSGMPDRATVARELETKLANMKQHGEHLDVITFSGNGEPTVNPSFAEIIDDTLALRDKYFPDVKVSVLTNSTMLHSQRVMDALRKVDNCLLKLDSAIDSTIKTLDRPVNPSFKADDVIEKLACFGSSAIIQTMFTRGSHNGVTVDNTTPEEIDALIKVYKKIGPRQITIYSLDRPSPEKSLQRVMPEELAEIARHIKAETGIDVIAV